MLEVQEKTVWVKTECAIPNKSQVSKIYLPKYGAQ
jgi:hypothetical protein